MRRQIARILDAALLDGVEAGADEGKRCVMQQAYSLERRHLRTSGQVSLSNSGSSPDTEPPAAECRSCCARTAPSRLDATSNWLKCQLAAESRSTLDLTMPRSLRGHEGSADMHSSPHFRADIWTCGCSAACLSSSSSPTAQSTCTRTSMGTSSEQWRANETIRKSQCRPHTAPAVFWRS